jgi:hypothetical protein
VAHPKKGPERFVGEQAEDRHPSNALLKKGKPMQIGLQYDNLRIQWRNSG